MPLEQLEQPQAIRTIFFDAGFTLLTPARSTPEICQQVCKDLGLHLHLEEVEQRLYDAEEYFFRHRGENRHTWADEQAIADLWTGYYTTLLRPFVEEHDEVRLSQLAEAVAQEYKKHTNWKTYGDVRPTLEALRAHGYTLGVISDWGISLGPLLRSLHLTQYFDCLLVSAQARHAKPSPMLYELALQRTNAVADYTVHIGDSYIFDVLGARSVGITPILLDRGNHVEQKSVDCLLLHSLYELLSLLEVPFDEKQQDIS